MGLVGEGRAGLEDQVGRVVEVATAAGQEVHGEEVLVLAGQVSAVVQNLTGFERFSKWNGICVYFPRKLITVYLLEHP